MKDQDRKKLWGRSGNICSYPNCGVELAPEEKGGRLIGEEAHIKGDKPKAPRWDPQQSKEERDAYENRILLCPNHHTEIDAYPKHWTVERLLEIKHQHEEQIKKNRQHPKLIEELERLVQQYAGPEEPNDYFISDLDDDDIRTFRVDASIEMGVSTKIKVKPGQKLQFFARGLISFDDRATFATPEGVLCNEYGFPLVMQDESGENRFVIMESEAAYKTDNGKLGRAGSLYGWIDTNTPATAFFIGTKRGIETNKEGYLFLAVNDAKGTYGDNDGEFRVDIIVLDQSSS